jgi:predicted Zn-dependent protease with MMP-like domain
VCGAGGLRVLPDGGRPGGRARVWREAAAITEDEGGRDSSRHAAARGALTTAMTREQFEALANQAFLAIPRRFRSRMRNVAVVVEDEPDRELLREMEIEPPDTLFGLYQGVPLTERGWDYGNRMPDRIVIYQRPIEQACEGDEEQVLEEVCATIIHEAGHYFGLSEDEIEAIEERWWNGDELDGDDAAALPEPPHRRGKPR